MTEEEDGVADIYEEDEPNWLVDDLEGDELHTRRARTNTRRRRLSPEAQKLAWAHATLVLCLASVDT